MSTVSISYSSLRAASNEAEAVAKKLDKYADALENKVYKKLNKYDGERSSNVSTALSKTNNKIIELRDEQSKYEAYASDLKDLRDECKSVDKAVRSRVSTLTASFKERNGIRNSKVENAISYFFTGLKNSTAAGRWIDRQSDDFKTGMSYIKSSIKERYNYEGGKEAIKAILIVALDIVIAVAGVVAAIATFIAGTLTFGAVLVLVAAVVGALITAQNIWTNVQNEKAAYAARQNGDPATGKRRSAINSYTDYLRSSYIFGDDGATYYYDEYYHKLALGIDITNFACTAVTLVSSVGKLLKNGYKWATGSPEKLTDIRMKEVFSAKSWNAFKGKIGGLAGNGWADIKAAFKYRDFSVFKDFGTRIFSDFGKNFMDEFWNFGSVKDVASTIKNIASIPKDIIEGGLTFSNVISVGFKGIVLPSITAFQVTNMKTEESGQMYFDFWDNVVTSDFESIFDKGGKTLTQIGDIFSNLADLFSGRSDINISIPEINVPTVEMMA